MIVVSIVLALVAAGCGIALLRLRDLHPPLDRPGTDQQFGRWLNDQPEADAAEWGRRG